MTREVAGAVSRMPEDDPSMGVIFISPLAPPYYSGAGEAIMCTARHLKQQGVQVAVLALREDDAVPSWEVLEDGVPIFRCTTRFGRLWHLWFHLWCALWLARRARSWDVIQCAYMPRYWMPLRVMARLLGKRVFLRMTLLGSDDLAAIQRGRLGNRRIKRYQNVDGIWVMGQEFINRSAAYLRDPDRFCAIPKMIDVAVFHGPADDAAKQRLRAKIGAGAEQRMVVFVGAISARKGVDLLVEAWTEVVKVVPEALLYLVGPRTFWVGAEQANAAFIHTLDERIEALGLDERIVCTGQVSNVPEYLRAADLFVFPSRQEATHPNALLEAMASGLPVVVCKYPWLPDDLVLHNETGMVCRPDAEALAESLIAGLRDREKAERMGRAAAEAVRRRHDPATVTEQLLGAYRAALARAR